MSNTAYGARTTAAPATRGTGRPWVAPQTTNDPAKPRAAECASHAASLHRFVTVVALPVADESTLYCFSSALSDVLWAVAMVCGQSSTQCPLSTLR